MFLFYLFLIYVSAVYERDPMISLVYLTTGLSFKKINNVKVDQLISLTQWPYVGSFLMTIMKLITISLLNLRPECVAACRRQNSHA